MIAVPIDGWLHSSLVSAGGCTDACRVGGMVFEQHVSLEHGERKATVRLPKVYDPNIWDRFVSAWAYLAAECHADTLIDLSLEDVA